MKKKIIKILAITIILLLIFINISNANEIIDWSNVKISQNQDHKTNDVIYSVINIISQIIPVFLLIISFILTIIEKIKSKNIKSLSLRIWIILAAIFWFLCLLIKTLSTSGGCDIDDINNKMLKEEKIKFIMTFTLITLAEYFVVFVMLLLPIKKIKKYKKSDKISKGENQNVRND